MGALAWARLYTDRSTTATWVPGAAPTEKLVIDTAEPVQRLWQASQADKVRLPLANSVVEAVVN